MPRRLVINCAALSPAMLDRDDLAPNLAELADRGRRLDLRPILPAVTCPMQATLTTGASPGEHGIVANGFYLRDLAEVRFWEQPERLVEAPRCWRSGGERPRVAMLFWQNSLWADVDCMLTPKPLHTESGLVNDCYGRPAGLYDELRAELGEFPLHRYWGPMAGVEASEWIAAATEHVWRTQRPDLCLTYLPLMDYNTQRVGPDTAGLAEDLRELDRLVGRLVGAARSDGAEVLVLSEYSLAPVRRDVSVNRVLRQADLLTVRDVAGREYLDAGASRAVAMVDHQVAHVYVSPGPGDRREALIERTADLLGRLDGVAEVLGADAQAARGLRHARSGELVCVAEPDAWFSYYWWFDDERAPDFARTVDIHNKPGYDPVELFADPATRTILLDGLKVRGSHGRAGPDDPPGVLIASEAAGLPADRGEITAAEVAPLIWPGMHTGA